MIKSKVGNIKSGWRSVFMVFTAAADDDTEPIVESAFENVEQGMNLPILSSYLFFVVSVIGHCARLTSFCPKLVHLLMCRKKIF